MSDEKVLALVEQRQVAFYGEGLTAMLVEDVPFSSLYGPFVMIRLLVDRPTGTDIIWHEHLFVTTERVKAAC